VLPGTHTVTVMYGVSTAGELLTGPLSTVMVTTFGPEAVPGWPL
jgi:hypothetical protein